MLITNFKKITTNSLREKALLIAEAGYEAIDIESLISKRVRIEGNKLKLENFFCENGEFGQKCEEHKVEFDLDNFKKIYLIGIGKGSALAVKSLAGILGSRVSRGIALDVSKPSFNLILWLRGLKFLKGTHPLPSKKNIRATRKIIKLAEKAKENDLIISFICGGGSALVCASESELNQSTLIIKELTRAGAQIGELNAVRKHLSEFKGGGLAKIVYPASMISLIVSDVYDNDLSIVASGPTVFDKTSKEDVENILKKYNFNLSDFNFIETPKDEKYFSKVKNVLFVSNQDAIAAMASKAKDSGFITRVYSLVLKGEAKESLLPIIETIKPGEVILAAGETTVNLASQRLNGKIITIGKGGRNQEAILGVVSHFSRFKAHISNNLVVVSVASDGWDNTEAAGAVGDYSILAKADKLRLNPVEFLENHNSFNFFEKTGDLVFAKQNSFNVADLMIVAKGE